MDKTQGQAVLDLFSNLHKIDPAGFVNAGYYPIRTETSQELLLEECKKTARKNGIAGGIGRKTKNPDDYVVRTYRGSPKMFLKREHAAPIEFLKAVVYTREAYLQDPDVLAEPDEQNRIKASPATHVLVAVLAGAVESFVSPYRFIANLAGGNLDYAADKMSHADLVELAQKVKAFSDEWSVVAD